MQNENGKNFIYKHRMILKMVLISLLPNTVTWNYSYNNDNKFSINAGGTEIRTADGILFEAENSSLGPGSFYITSTEQWAGSLRYYGIGLEKGPYSVSLLFAETVFDDGSLQTWKSIGSRVFDIYIQGELRLKDFDISKEGGGPRKVYMLFWGGKCTCYTPVEGYYGPSILALSVVSELFNSEYFSKEFNWVLDN